MLHVILINKDEADLRLKWPLEEKIMFALHKNKDGDMFLFHLASEFAYNIAT